MREQVRIETAWSKNMQLRVAAPVGEGWQRMETGEQPDGLLAAIKCLHGTPPDAVALDAYVYRVPEGEGPTVEALAERDWEAHFRQKMLAEVTSVDVRVVEHPLRAGFKDEGCEVTVDGTLREPAQPLRVRERHVPASGKLLVVSAAAQPEMHERHAKLIDAWLTHAALGGE